MPLIRLCLAHITEGMIHIFLMALNNCTDQHHKNDVGHNKARAKIRKKDFFCATI